MTRTDSDPRALDPDAMSSLDELLTDAFGQSGAAPSEPKLSAAIEATAYWTFSAHLEVVLAEAKQLPAEGKDVADL
jgi:hypothetical protein